MAKTQPKISFRMTKEGLQSSVITVTVKRRLCKAKLWTRRPRKVPWLKKGYVLKRLQLAKEHIDWAKEKWCIIMRTDESKVIPFGSSLSDDPQTMNSSHNTL